jgi:alpha-D-ribose 1-methylphosphonate 5-triphosphate diphosphatase
MSAERVLRNARIVLPDEAIRGSVRIVAGRIADIDSGNSAVAAAEDWEGDWLLPGLVELHTDNLEKHITPRPGVHWPGLPAVLAHDAQVVAAGITTVFDAIALGEVKPGGDRTGQLDGMLDAINTARSRGLLRAEHQLHLRCELSSKGIPEMFERLAQDPRVRLVSLMDHTPGQRQFSELSKYREYYQGKYGLSDAEMDDFTARQIESQKKFSAANRRAIVASCRARALSLASHDDSTPEHVAEAAGEGVSIAEFPTTLQAARAAHQLGLGILMGAPNVVRGGSHSGNISAHELACAGFLDCLSSDYVPSSLLHAAFILSRDAGWSIPRAVASVSAVPAQMGALADRGAIRIGLRADIIRTRDSHGIPVVLQVLRAGQRVL